MISTEVTEARPLLKAHLATTRHIKQCPRCDGKAECVDSRPYEGRTRRRYRCKPCGVRWTTMEVLVEDVALLTLDDREGIEHTARQLILLAGALRRFLE